MRPLEIGGGVVQREGDRWRLRLPADLRAYADAQIDDNRWRARRHFPWAPPLQLSVRARSNLTAPLGTLGFGFWNDPFALTLGQGGAARRLPAAPQALWFFYGSPPNDLGFAPDAPGSGWKAASLRTPQVPSALLALPAAAAFVLSRLPGIRRPVMQLTLGAVSASEAALETRLDEWHEYRLEWWDHSARFWVDDRLVLQATDPPPAPLGFVAWIDNQFAVASVERGLRFGVLPTDKPQELELAGLAISRPERPKKPSRRPFGKDET